MRLVAITVNSALLSWVIFVAVTEPLPPSRTVLLSYILFAYAPILSLLVLLFPKANWRRIRQLAISINSILLGWIAFIIMTEGRPNDGTVLLSFILIGVVPLCSLSVLWFPERSLKGTDI